MPLADYVDELWLRFTINLLVVSDLGIPFFNKMVVCITWCRGWSYPLFKKNRLHHKTLIKAIKNKINWGRWNYHCPRKLFDHISYTTRRNQQRCTVEWRGREGWGCAKATVRLRGRDGDAVRRRKHTRWHTRAWGNARDAEMSVILIDHRLKKAGYFQSYGVNLFVVKTAA